MTKKATAILVGIGVLVIGATIVGCAASPQGQQTSGPTASRTSAETAASTAPPPGTPSPTIPVQVAATCANTSTVGFQALAAVNGWGPKEDQDRPSGGNPFARFPSGSPDGAVSCWWAPDGGGTDNAVFIAWARIGADAAAAAEQLLVGEGAMREDTPVGVYISFAGQGGGDSTYLFTDQDVRWALYTHDLGYVKAPEQSG